MPGSEPLTDLSSDSPLRSDCLEGCLDSAGSGSLGCPLSHCHSWELESKVVIE